MQSTTYYELSQYEANDKPTWLVGYNGDMAKIDAGIHEAKAAADDAQSTATSADGKADTNADAISDLNTAVGNLENAVGGAQGNINTLNALMGNGTPTTSDQTVIGAINALEATIATSEDGATFANAYQVGDQFMRGGTLYEALEPIASGTAWSAITLNTDVKIADKIVDQVNKYSELDGMWFYASDLGLHVDVEGDGVKTDSQLCTELANAILEVAQNLADDEIMEVIELQLIATAPCDLLVHYKNNATAIDIRAQGVTGQSNAATIFGARISTNSSNNMLYYWALKADGTNTLTDFLSNVPASGASRRAIYRILKKFTV